MQQVPDKRITNLAPWAYFLGLGVAIGVSSVGTVLNVLLHNSLLSYGLGLISGLTLGLLGVQFFGAAFVRQIEKQQSHKPAQRTAKASLSWPFFVGMGIALCSGSIGIPLGIALHNMVFGVGIGISIGITIGIVVAQLIKITCKSA